METFFRWTMAVTHDRYYRFVTALLLKRLRDGHFTSGTEAVTWIQKWFKNLLKLLESPRCDRFSRRRRRAWL
jgi:hypothetical protein